jgi:predicted O-methyltransferase YrrM
MTSPTEEQLRQGDGVPRSRDAAVFDAIPSETTPSDRESLLLLRDCARSRGPYVYLEIGSYLGGTLQPFYADDRCRLIYSIDERPDFVPDERGRFFYHYDRQVNSTATMLANLAKAFPAAEPSRVRTFDCDASEVDRHLIAERPHVCFIDAEHTNDAVFEDFQFCLEVCHPDAVVAFHDAGIVFGGIRRIKEHLADRAVHFRGFKLGGSVYAILLNEAVGRHADELGRQAIDEDSYFREAERELVKARKEYGRFGAGTIKRALTGAPFLFRTLRALKRRLVRPDKGSI